MQCRSELKKPGNLKLTKSRGSDFGDHERLRNKGSDFGAVFQRAAMEAAAMGAIMSNFGEVIQRAAMERVTMEARGMGARAAGRARATAMEKRRPRGGGRE
jgi:hypothetical protein